ncbi:MAG: hypothetical protein HKN63_01205 [Rhodobacteraceae bacterium]|nr:hypothetical protein [Paracoccaceae bacterium]
MIHIFVCRRNNSTMNRLKQAEAMLGCRIAVHTYSGLFGRREVPVGTLIFTDFDHLKSYEIDAAALAMNAALTAAPETTVFNRPERALQRTALISRLQRLGLNEVEVVRADTGKTPKDFPVFVRQEDGCGGPETGLLQSAAEYKAALTDLAATGRTLSGRIALSFAAEPDSEGYYLKYGAFVIGRHIVPQHILRSAEWNVKSSSTEMSPAFIEKELAYITENPHADALRQIAEAGCIDYGRIDYGMRDGRIVVFEINTNPVFPRFIGGSADREERRRIIVGRLSDAFREIEYTGPARTVPFDDTVLKNSTFIERDSWLRHPHVALRQKAHWQRALGRIRWQGALSRTRWQTALGRRWSNLRFRLSRIRRQTGRN